MGFLSRNKRKAAGVARVHLERDVNRVLRDNLSAPNIVDRSSSRVSSTLALVLTNWYFRYERTKELSESDSVPVVAPQSRRPKLTIEAFPCGLLHLQVSGKSLFRFPSRSTRGSTLPRESSTSKEDQKNVETDRRRPGNIGSRLTSKLRELWNLRVPSHPPSTQPPITLSQPAHTPASPGIPADTAAIPVPPGLTFDNTTLVETASPGVQTDTTMVPVSGNATPTEIASPGIQTDATTSPVPLLPMCGITDPTEATSTLSPADASTIACSMVPQNDPCAIEYREVVLPKLRKMMAHYFSNSARGEPIEVFLKWGDNGKPTVFIICRMPKKMSKAIKNSGCINHQIFDVKIEKGPDLRYTAEQRIRLEHENHSLSIPDLSSCASGFPIRSFHKNKLLGLALIGGVLWIDGKLWGLTVFHFLKEPQKKDGIMTESEREPGSSTSGENSEVSSLNSVSTMATDETSSPNPPLSDIDISLQPWAQTETEGKPIQLIRICWASGTRLSKWPYYQPRDTSTESGDFGIENIRCIMDWALVDLGDIPIRSNRYVNRDDELKIIRSTTDPGDKRVDILVNGKVYCEGCVSGNPCLLGLQDTGGYGLAFMVSTDQEGISGAWIVDSKTSELIGHLFAVSASSNRGYFIPINETFKDISATLKADKIHLQIVSDEQSGDIVNSSLPSPHYPHDSGQSTEFPQLGPVSTPVRRQTNLQKAVQGARSFTVVSIQKHQLVHSPDPFTPSGFNSETTTDNLTSSMVKSLSARLNYVRKGFCGYNPITTSVRLLTLVYSLAST
ncbi:hypothetical protein BDD12DRAFT_807067 [Trichophaea hybrida]|nr:hypothetical protein BDD12DRAFT_807067 [Trichophaea hybrida]